MLLPTAGVAQASSHHHAVTPADDNYGGGVKGGSAGGGGAGGVLGGTAGGLPFTGANLLMILGSGAALIGVGAGVRVAGSRRS